MSCRVVFKCETCGAEPDPLTRVSLERQLLHFRFAQYVDAGDWLVWHGRGPYGRTLYACQEHRLDLRGYVRKHYAGALTVANPGAHPSLPPDDFAVARRRARYQGWASPIR